ncbi:MAG: hypothetical protein DRO06_00335, partial [Thermoproteota archaeon]
MRPGRPLLPLLALVLLLSAVPVLGGQEPEITLPREVFSPWDSVEVCVVGLPPDAVYVLTPSGRREALTLSPSDGRLCAVFDPGYPVELGVYRVEALYGGGAISREFTITLLELEVEGGPCVPGEECVISVRARDAITGERPSGRVSAEVGGPEHAVAESEMEGGEAQLSFTPRAEGIYSVSIEAESLSGAVGRMNLSIFVGEVRVETDREAYSPGDCVRVIVEAPPGDYSLLVTGPDGREWVLEGEEFCLNSSVALGTYRVTLLSGGAVAGEAEFLVDSLQVSARVDLAGGSPQLSVVVRGVVSGPLDQAEVWVSAGGVELKAESAGGTARFPISLGPGPHEVLVGVKWRGIEVVRRVRVLVPKPRDFITAVDPVSGEKWLLLFPGAEVDLCRLIGVSPLAPVKLPPNLPVRVSGCRARALRIAEFSLPLSLERKEGGLKPTVSRSARELSVRLPTRVGEFYRLSIPIPPGFLASSVEPEGGGEVAWWSQAGDQVVVYYSGEGFEVKLSPLAPPPRPREPRVIRAIGAGGEIWELVEDPSSGEKRASSGAWVSERLLEVSPELNVSDVAVVVWKRSWRGLSLEITPLVKEPGTWIRVPISLPEDLALVGLRSEYEVVCTSSEDGLVLYIDPGPVTLDFSDPEWWDPDGVGTGYDWHFRVPVTVASGGPGSMVALDVNFSSLLSQLGVSGDFDENSVRVVKASGAVLSQQEFTDRIYGGATDPEGNGLGEVRFILEDQAPVTYYIYFDVVENGAKPEWTGVINGNFEHSSPGEQNPPGWTSGAYGSASHNRETHPTAGEGDTVSVSDSYTGDTELVDNTPRTGDLYFLLGFRDYEEDGASGVHEEVWLERTIRVPPEGGTLSFYFQLQGWDSKTAGDGFDYVRVYLNGSVTQPRYVDNSDGHLISDSYGFGRNNSYLGWGNYDDLGWRRAELDLSNYSAGFVTVRITLRAFTDNICKTWVKIDDVEWAVTTDVSLGSPEGFGINIVEPADTGAGNPESVYLVGQAVTFRVRSEVGQYLESGPGNTMEGIVERWDGADWVQVDTLTLALSSTGPDYAEYTASWTAPSEVGRYRLVARSGQPPDYDNGYVAEDVQTFLVAGCLEAEVGVDSISDPEPCWSPLPGDEISSVSVVLKNSGGEDALGVNVTVTVYNQTDSSRGSVLVDVPAASSVEASVPLNAPLALEGLSYNISVRLFDSSGSPWSDPDGSNDERHRVLVLGWWSADWAYRRKVVVFSEGDARDYQVPAELSSSWFDYSKTAPGGADLRFVWYDPSSGSLEELSYWIETWDPSGDSRVWVKVPSLRARWEVPVFMYYGNPSAPPASDLDATMDFLEVRTVTTSNTVQAGDSGDDPSTWTWDLVQLEKSFDSPVVVAQFLSYNGRHSAVIRIRNVGPNSLEVRVIEPSTRDNVHLPETVGVLALNEGTYRLLDGTRLEAHRLTTTATVGRNVDPDVWETLEFSLSYPVDPIVLSQPMTSNDVSRQARFLKTRERGLRDADGSFELALEEEYDNTGQRSTAETVAWIAIERPALDSPKVGALPRQTNDPSPVPYEVGVAYDAVRGIANGWYPASFTASFGSTPVLVLGYGSYDGPDNSELRYSSLTSSGFQVAVEEDYTRGTGMEWATSHVTEDVFWFAVGEPGAYPIAKLIDPEPSTSVCPEERVPLKISGMVFEDLDSDGQEDPGEPGIGGALIRVYEDDGDGSLDDGDSLVSELSTEPDGTYEAAVTSPGLYFVVVDSRSLSSSRPLNPGHSEDELWAEQTYGCDAEPDLSCGPRFGGLDPEVSDLWDYSSAAVSDNVYEHVSRVRVQNSPVEGVDFGFSFDVVVNSRDADDDPSGPRWAQGTLRQFIQNANALSGSDESRFVMMTDPDVVEDPSHSWWVIKVDEDLGDLPPIEDGYTILNGTVLNPDMSPRDENQGALPGGPVGAGPDGLPDTGDEPSIPPFDRPEVAIDGSRLSSGVIRVYGDHSVLCSLSIYNGSRLDWADNTGAAVHVGAVGVTLEDLFLNAFPNGTLVGSVPAVDARDWADSSGLTIRHCLLGSNHALHLAYNAILDGLTVEECDFRGSPPGLMLGGGDACVGCVVRRCYFRSGGEGQSPGRSGWAAVEFRSAVVRDAVVEDCTIVANHPSHEEGVGVSLGSNTEDVVIRRNLIMEAASSAVILSRHSPTAPFPQNVTITRNSIFNSSWIGIDHGYDNVTLNDGVLDPSQPNSGVDYPVIEEAIWDGSRLFVSGYVNSEGAGSGSPEFAGSTIEVYLVRNLSGGDDLSGNELGGRYYGEGWAYLGSLTADASGEFSEWLDLSSIPSRYAPEPGSLVTATATLEDVGTSEFGPDRVVMPQEINLTASKSVEESAPRRVSVTLTLLNGGGQTAPACVYDLVPRGASMVSSSPPPDGSSPLGGGTLYYWCLTVPASGSESVGYELELSGDARLSSAIFVGIDPPDNFLRVSAREGVELSLGPGGEVLSMRISGELSVENPTPEVLSDVEVNVSPSWLSFFEAPSNSPVTPPLRAGEI